MLITVHDFKVELSRAYKENTRSRAYKAFLPPKCHNSLFHQRGIIMQVATCVRMPRNAGQSAKYIAGAKFHEILQRQHNAAITLSYNIYKYNKHIFEQCLSIKRCII
jgi:hypothetical protein